MARQTGQCELAMAERRSEPPDPHIRAAAPARSETLVARAWRWEWPTWAMLCLCYGLWTAALAVAGSAPAPIAALALLLLAAPAVALHASLQHEALHGHPTRSAAWNEALVFPSLSLAYPYRRFKTLHLRHHRDERLTDPYDDPESYYWAERDWSRATPLLRALWRCNAALLGRLLIGPWLGVVGVWRGDWLEARRDPKSRAAIRAAYLRHAAGVSITLGVAWGLFGVSPLAYILLAAWPGLSLLMLRTFAEHRAAERVGARTAIVEAEAPFALLFLNNNLHAVHHAHPRRPWYELPALWRRDRERILAQNEGYRIAGYREVARRWLFRVREPIAHPYARRSDR